MKAFTVDTLRNLLITQENIDYMKDEVKSKKLSKQQKKIKKERFMADFGGDLVSKYYPKVKLFPHFIKIEIDGIECDYYPGAERLNRITNKTNEWSDLNHQDFLNHLVVSYGY
jgi:hypothetical protein